MNTEDLYVDNVLIRTINLFDPRLTACLDMLESLPQFGRIPDEALMYWGYNNTVQKYGYTERTLTCYYRYTVSLGPVHLVQNDSLYVSNQPIMATGIKYCLDSVSKEYKYLMDWKVKEDMPVPDTCVLSYYSLSCTEQEQKDQIDVYFTLPEYEDLVQYAHELKLPVPIQDDELFDASDLIGVTFIRTALEPVRLKYYKRNNITVCIPQSDGSFISIPVEDEDSECL